MNYSVWARIIIGLFKNNIINKQTLQGNTKLRRQKYSRVGARDCVFNDEVPWYSTHWPENLRNRM